MDIDHAINAPKTPKVIPYGGSQAQLKGSHKERLDQLLQRKVLELRHRRR